MTQATGIYALPSDITAIIIDYQMLTADDLDEMHEDNDFRAAASKALTCRVRETSQKIVSLHDLVHNLNRRLVGGAYQLISSTSAENALWGMSQADLALPRFDTAPMKFSEWKMRLKLLDNRHSQMRFAAAIALKSVPDALFESLDDGSELFKYVRQNRFKEVALVDAAVKYDDCTQRKCHNHCASATAMTLWPTPENQVSFGLTLFNLPLHAIACISEGEVFAFVAKTSIFSSGDYIFRASQLKWSTLFSGSIPLKKEPFHTALSTHECTLT